MRPFLFAVLFGLCTAPTAGAQSLDIGGIELRLGQPVDEALRSLSPYRVQRLEDVWSVSQKAGDHYDLLGVISATANAITSIRKYFTLEENEDAGRLYALALKEARRRGGTICSTRNYEASSVPSFFTDCGPYTATVTMPFRDFQKNRIRAGVSLAVHK